MMLIVALLSAVFSKDIVCLAIAPVLISACEKRRLDPVPYLLALACAANIGSAWTLIGSPKDSHRLASPRTRRLSGDIGDAGDHRRMACATRGARGVSITRQDVGERQSDIIPAMRP
jgi:hypothetical protein